MIGRGPRPGDRVRVADPLGYSGPAVVVAVSHGAVSVRLSAVTDRADQSATTRDVWVLAPHVTPADDCTSVGFSGAGRCLEPAVCSRTTDAGQRRVCFQHFASPTYAEYEETAQ